MRSMSGTGLAIFCLLLVVLILAGAVAVGLSVVTALLLFCVTMIAMMVWLMLSDGRSGGRR